MPAVIKTCTTSKYELFYCVDGNLCPLLSAFMSHLFAPYMLKVEFIIEQDIKAQRGSRGIALLCM